ncbi:MAG: hypothetical protein IT293_06330 [Deltaproteobacteria bacterium]|nr:hypothetical protein [Deltaproteobacteria bacterium]
MKIHHRWIAGVVAAALAATLAPARVRAADDLESLRREIDELRRRDAERQREIDALETEVQRLRDAQGMPQPAALPSPAAAASALDRAVGALATEPSAPAAPVSSPALVARRIGSAEIKLLDVSFDTMLAAGGSTVPDHEVEELEGGDHDPQRRGFTLQQAELSFTGAVDPYFTAEAHVVLSPDHVELEEAFFTSTSLPWNLQLEGGYFLTEFGRINPTHSHAWDWIDQPIVVTRMFGGEGLRSPGARLAWLSPLPWFAEFQVGVQNANEEHTTPSFMGDEAIGGRPAEKTNTGSMKDLLYLARWKNAWNWSGGVTTQLGFSGLFGPNATGGDGRTYLYGTDMVWKWQPPDHFRGWPFVTWQSEIMRRDYRAAAYVDPEDPNADLAGDTLRDWGLYAQALWGFHYQWAAGLRYEYAGGSGASVDGRQNDPRRDDRHRVAPLIIWQPSEYARIRLQYDFDHAEFLSEKDAHSVWLGFEVLYGAHPAHQY